MTKFRPCIDLHHGIVKQIVGGTLGEGDVGLKTNFESQHPAEYYAARYREDGLTGGHVIQLGPGNREAALSALAAYPDGLQLGGGVTVENAVEWLEAGASHVIVTSWLFDSEGHFQVKRLKQLSQLVGPERLVVDLSCRREDSGWTVAMNRWQTLTDLSVTGSVLATLAEYCDEFLIHAADVEGKCEGIDGELVEFLGKNSPIPVTYAGGARDIKDLASVDQLSAGRVDLTIGSALDLFGGHCIRYADCLKWNSQSADE